MNIFSARFLAFDYKKSFHRLRKGFRKSIRIDNIRYASKVGLAVILAHALSLLLGFENNPWAPISAIVVMQVHVAGSLEMCLFRGVGTLIGALLGYFSVKLLPAGVLGQSLALLITSSLCAFVMRWDPRFRLAGLTSVVVIAGSTLTPNIAFFAMDRMFEIIIGIVSALLVSVYIWPVSGANMLFLKLKGQYCLSADLLEKLTAAFLNKQTHLLPSILNKLHANVGENRTEFSKVQEYEGLGLYQQFPQMDILVSSLEQIRTYLTSMLDSLDSDVEEGVELEIAPELANLSKACAASMNWVVNCENAPPESMPDVRTPLDICARRFATLRNQGNYRGYSHEVVLQIFAFYNALSHLAETQAVLQERIELLNSSPEKAH